MKRYNSLNDRMKVYENHNKQFLLPNSYAIMRLDGKGFSKFTKKYFKKPFDLSFANMMNETTKYLVNNIQGCLLGYTQSDEITLVLSDLRGEFQDVWFGWRVDKMCSVGAGMATAKFGQMLTKKLLQSEFIVIPSGIDSYPLPVFDARCFNVPNLDEVINCLIWRQQDCERNSVQMLAQSKFSHKVLMNQSVENQKEMLLKHASTNWNELPEFLKYGYLTYKETNSDGIGCTHNKESHKFTYQSGFDLFNNILR